MMGTVKLPGAEAGLHQAERETAALGEPGVTATEAATPRHRRNLSDATTP